MFLKTCGFVAVVHQASKKQLGQQKPLRKRNLSSNRPVQNQSSKRPKRTALSPQIQNCREMALELVCLAGGATGAAGRAPSF
jgi:hypothetical protein